VERIEVKDAALPESMKRSMSRQAEAERERRARIISADDEYQASGKLAQAATVMAAAPKHQPPYDRRHTGCVPICTGQQALLADAALPWRASPSPQRRPGGQPSAAEAGALPATLQ
jgi:hypothetical protein